MVEQTAAEAKQLRACINDLIGVVALPAIWRGSAPTEIVRTLLDMLLSILHLDFAYLRLKDPVGGSPFEVVRFAHSHTVTVQSDEFGKLLKGWPEGDPQKWPRLVQNPFGDRELSIVPLPLGLGGEIGILVAGCRRADFPVQTERLLLSVAANQATIGLQEARLLSEQKRVADELDRRVAQRGEELAAANKELQNRERRIRRLVDANILGIFSWDLEGAIVEANEAFLNMLQHDREDVASGRVRWIDLTPPEWRERDEHALAQLKATGMVQPYEKEYFRRDGSRVPVLVAGALFEEGGGEGVAFALDLSEQKRAQEKFRESEARLQAFFENTPNLIFLKDRQGRYLSVNKEFKRAFRITDGQVRGKKDDEIFSAEQAAAFQGNDRLVLEAGVPMEFEELALQEDGQHTSIVHKFPLFNTEGEIYAIGGIVTDITERKKEESARRYSEERHRVVVETATDAVVSADESGAIQFANPATMRVFGYDQMELTGKPLTVLMPEFMRKLHENGFRHYLATGQRHINWQGTELTGLRKNGQEFPVEVSFGELTMNGHRVFTGFIRDITERKRAEEERERLRQAQADLAHINRVSTMGELTAALTHEVKQPIAAAVTNAKTCIRWLSRDQPDLMEARDAASRLIKDVTRASDIISRIGSLFKKGLPQREMVDVNEIIREMIALLRSEAARHSISIDGDLASDVPQIMADRVQLQQVLMNLMLNGIEAMSDLSTPGRLTITSRPEENGQLLISVADVGTGIKPEQAEQIFNAFFTSKPQGTGMGLAISRSIIESHGGRLWATPNSGPGTTFRFTLPIEAVAREVA